MAAYTDRNAKSNNVPEWTNEKKWNPFNSYKLLAHVERWKKITRGGIIPPPVLVTVDPTNLCNFNCEWCNASYIRNASRSSISKAKMYELADFLTLWGKKNFPDDLLLKAICVAGGGEPLLNNGTPHFIEKVTQNGIEVGLVTNAFFVDSCIEPLSNCTWVGVSVDAGTATTYAKHKKVDEKCFYKVIDNIRLLSNYSKKHNKTLGSPNMSYGVSYKYLLYKDNINEIYEAAKLAKEIGCKNIHFRPAGTSWDQLGKKEIVFTEEEIATFNDQMALALELDDETFGVYGITHKFNSQFSAANTFNNCYAIFMTAVFMPHPTNETAIRMGLCCDRRGDGKLELIDCLTDMEQINSTWGKEEHWKIYDSIRVEMECPRCTYQPHNQIYENVILKDSMTYKFI